MHGAWEGDGFLMAYHLQHIAWNMLYVVRQSDSEIPSATPEDGNRNYWKSMEQKKSCTEGNVNPLGLHRGRLPVYLRMSFVKYRPE